MRAPASLPATRGRPREFDADEVLDEVLDLFWQRGYEAASLADIVRSSGINKSSLYNAFGSKRELFAAVLDRYLERVIEPNVARLTNGDAGLDDLVEFVTARTRAIQSPLGRRGCLAVNSASELGFDDPDVVEYTRRFRALLRSGFLAALRRAADRAEIDDDTVAHRAEILVAVVVGLAVTARGGASASELEATTSSLVAMIESWRR